METKASHIIIGSFMVLLTIALFSFVIWLARVDAGTTDQYDIFFQDSVAGLTQGGAVRFNGVPVGSVSQIALVPDDPRTVRVRVRIDDDTPVFQGTVATLEAQGLTGLVFVQLTGSMAGTQKIDESGPYGVPVIPSQPSALQELFVGAPELLQQATLAVTRLGALLDDENRESVQSTLRNVEQFSAVLAQQAPNLSETMTELTATMVEFRTAAASFASLSEAADTLVREESRTFVRDVARLTRRTEQMIGSVDAMLKENRPGLQQFTQGGLVELTRLIGDMRELTRNMNQVVERLDDGVARGLLTGERLPDYEGN